MLVVEDLLEVGARIFVVDVTLEGVLVVGLPVRAILQALGAVALKLQAGRIIGGLRPGDTVSLEIIRDGKPETIEIELKQRPTALSGG